MRGTSPRGCGVAWPGPGHGYVEMLPDIAAPTLVGVGSDNDFTQVSDTQFMHERIKNSTLVIIEGAAHVPNLERAPEIQRGRAAA
jgi:3-oxoadipate enol-lactonase